MRPSQPARRYGLLVLGYGSLGLMMAWPLPLKLLSAIPGDGFDGWQNYWNLWWVRRALLVLGASPWYTRLLDYPAGVSLYFHTLNIPNGVLSLPVQESVGLVAAYNAVALASFSLGGLGAYLLALRAIGRRDAAARAAAFVAGVVFAFSPFHFAHLLGHMQVFAFQWLPFYCLTLLGLYHAIDDGDRRAAIGRAVLSVLFLLLSALVDWYNLLYLGLLTLLWSGWHGRRAGRRAWRYWLVGAAVGAATLLLLSPLLLPMAREALRDNYMVPDPAQMPALSADLMAYFLPQEMHPLWGRWAREIAGGFSASTSEHMLYLGVVPLVLAGIGWWRGGEGSRPFVWAALAFWVLSLGPLLHVGGKVVSLLGRPIVLPHLLLYQAVPFLGIARSVSRFSLLLTLSLAVLAGMGLTRLPGRRARAVAALVAALVVFEYLPAPYPTSTPDTPAWYVSLAKDREAGALLNLPANWDRPQYLLYQTVHGRPLLAGYTSRRNPLAPVEQYPGLQQLRALNEDVLAFPDAATFATIGADVGLRYVVLDYYQMPGGEERERTIALAERLLAGQDEVFRDDRLRVFRLQAPSERRPYARLTGPWGPRLPDGAPGRAGCGECGMAVVPAREGGEVRAVIGCDGGERQVEIGAGDSLLPGCALLRRIDIIGD